MILIIVSVLLGIIARTLIPYLQALRDNPGMKFDRLFFIPAIVTLLISLITAPFVFLAIPADQLNNVAPNFQSLLLLFAAAWGVTDVSREGQKFIASRSNSGNPPA